MTDTSRPQVRSWPCRGGHYAHFRKPGGGWQFVRAKGSRQAQIFPTAEAAKDAARELVFDFLCPPIVAARPDADPMEEKLVADFAGFEQRRAEQRAEDRKVFRGLGKGFVTVTTRKRKSA
jgi:hypothetical protein